MKMVNFIKGLFIATLVFSANLTVFANTPETSLVYNTEELDGMKLSETVYKMNGGILTNYEKYNYKYNDNKQVTENLLQKWDGDRKQWRNKMCIKYYYDNNNVTIKYYKWNANKKDFVLVPDMTVIMNQ